MSSASASASPEDVLAQLRAQLGQDLETAKANIEANLGNVVTEISQKVTQVDQTLLQLTAAGQQIMEEVDKKMVKWLPAFKR